MSGNKCKKISILLVAITLLIVSCSGPVSSTDYLEGVLGRLGKIETAEYFSVQEAWNPGDTAAVFVHTSYMNEYNNPADTALGASFVRLDSLTRSEVMSCYDGEMLATFFHDKNGIIIDSFKLRQLPFRPVSAPFYNYTESIIRYALRTDDSITIETEEGKNEFFMRLTINEEHQVEFFGKAVHMPLSPYTFGENTSVYEIWIDKKSGLPCKVRREMYHSISVETVVDPVFNKLDFERFRARDLFPADYEIRLFGENREDNTTNEGIIGKKAPGWVLKGVEGQSVALADYKSRVLMIQFTIINCGPCRASVDFLKELQNEYPPDEFEFVSIESSSNNMNALVSYMHRNNFNYTFLMGSRELSNQYSVQAYPMFFMVDRDRVVREIIRGYEPEVSDSIIRNAIQKLLD